MDACGAGAAGIAGTKGRGAGSCSRSAAAAGAVTEAGAFPKAEPGAFAIPLGGQTGCTLSDTLAAERHSVFHVGLTGSGVVGPTRMDYAAVAARLSGLGG